MEARDAGLDRGRDEVGVLEVDKESGYACEKGEMVKFINRVSRRDRVGNRLESGGIQVSYIEG